MKLELDVAYADGSTRRVTIKPVTQVAFERHFGQGLPAIANDTHVEHLYWMAWHTLRAEDKATPSDFDVWLANVAGIEGIEDDPDPS